MTQKFVSCEILMITALPNEATNELTIYGEVNLIFCCTGSRENYFRTFGRQNNNNPKFRVSASKNNIGHRGKDTCAMFAFLIHNKNSAIKVLLPFLFDLSEQQHF